ncbi:hypothetical protein M0802_001650 [Mischocyttarus mexicanus]|nr:hypothetical protein M0802_001650 [Mischocyttarus mexicanus]
MIDMELLEEEEEEEEEEDGEEEEMVERVREINENDDQQQTRYLIRNQNHFSFMRCLSFFNLCVPRALINESVDSFIAAFLILFFIALLIILLYPIDYVTI